MASDLIDGQQVERDRNIYLYRKRISTDSWYESKPLRYVYGSGVEKLVMGMFSVLISSL